MIFAKGIRDVLGVNTPHLEQGLATDRQQASISSSAFFYVLVVLSRFER